MLNLRGHFPLLLFLLSLCGACGGYDWENARKRGPRIEPEEYFVGKKKGQLVVMDRNGNLRESADVYRECTVGSSLAGSCQDRIFARRMTRRDSGAVGPDACPEDPEFHCLDREEQNTMEWTVQYENDTEASLTFADDRGSLSGRLAGSLLYVKGDRRIPGEGDESAHAKLCMFLLPGEGRPRLRTEDYSFLGIHLGRVEIFWLDEP